MKRFGTVCSGIGAPEVAWQRLGWIPVFSSEIEAFPNAVRSHHFPGVQNLGDMTKFAEWPKRCECGPGINAKTQRTQRPPEILTEANQGNEGKKEHDTYCGTCGGIDIDVLVGGTPCQSFSVAGLRAGMADPRGNLALTFLAIVERYAPQWVLWENVPGVHSSWSDAENRGETQATCEAGETLFGLAREAGFDDETARGFGELEEVDQTSDFDCFLSGLEQLGYGVATAISDAQFFGVAQRRRRVFVVGHIGGQWQRAAAVLFDAESLRGNPPPRRETRERVAASPGTSLAERGELLGGIDYEHNGHTANEPTGPILKGSPTGGGTNYQPLECGGRNL
jgi:DNA (cytosine-5)-methyltransferase 1